METNAAVELHVGVVHRLECTQPSLPPIGKQHARHDVPCPSPVPLAKSNATSGGGENGAVVGLTSHFQCRTDCCTVGYVGQSAPEIEHPRPWNP